MTTGTTCAREQDVLDLVAIGQWPARADAALVSHVDACPVCADLAAVAPGLAEIGETTAEDVRVPDAAVIWYGARLLARTEAARRAARPMVAVEIIAFVCLIGLAVVGWSSVGPAVADWWGGIRETWPSSPAAVAERLLATRFKDVSVAAWWVVGAVVAWVVLLPAALYLVGLANRTNESRAN